jgi:peptidoglycan/LPS O-acetylase OafA/YrhL
MSRFMRIFPPYWIVCIGIIIVSGLSGLIFKDWLNLAAFVEHPLVHNGGAGFLFTSFSNLTLVGQDWTMFLSHEQGQSLHFTADFWKDTFPLYRYELAPQCWTIGVELTFYALVPLLNRWRTRWLVALAAVSTGARLFGYLSLGLAHDPWAYRFFPFELSLFVFGMLGYRLHARVKCRWDFAFDFSSRSTYLLASAALLLVLYVQMKVTGEISRAITTEIGVLITYPFWVIGVPALFLIFGSNKLDRVIGELSYPIYLIYGIVLAAVTPLAGLLNQAKLNGVITAFFSIALAAAFYRWYIAPMDRKRHLLLTKRQDPPAAEPAKPVESGC